MNRKQWREMMRKIQSENLSLEVVHPHAVGIDIGNESHYLAVPPTRDSPTGAVLRVHYSRTEGHGQLAEAMWDSDRGGQYVSIALVLSDVSEGDRAGHPQGYSGG